MSRADYYWEDFFNNPGKLYNGGNFVTKAVVVCDVALSVLHTGSFSAVNWVSDGALLVSTVTFIYSGGKYDKAWENGFPPDARLNREGHAWSAVGAVFLGVGLAALGGTENSVTAATSGFIHAGAKLGSALSEAKENFVAAKKSLLPRICKDAVLVSRFPAVGYLGWNVVDKLCQSAEPSLALQTTPLFAFILGYALWARADYLHMENGESLLIPCVQSINRNYVRPIRRRLGL